MAIQEDHNSALTNIFSIALYLGESFASLKVFEKDKIILSKKVFLPQVNLRNLLQQVKKSLTTDFSENFQIDKPYIVTK